MNSVLFNAFLPFPLPSQEGFIERYLWLTPFPQLPVSDRIEQGMGLSQSAGASLSLVLGFSAQA